MEPLEQWLAAATKDLSPESTALVRAEIQQHYNSAGEAGIDALTALGNPRTANRGNRKVLLTELEAVAADLTTPKPTSVRFGSIALLEACLLNQWYPDQSAVR